MSRKNTPDISKPEVSRLACCLLNKAQTNAFGGATTQGGGMKDEQVRELLYQAIETEIRGVQV